MRVAVIGAHPGHDGKRRAKGAEALRRMGFRSQLFTHNAGHRQHLVAVRLAVV